MTLYRVTNEKLETIPTTSFANEGLLERKDLQRLLKADISPIADDLMVIAEEFGEWEESNRRIDLLCLDKQSRLVVVEIKRTDDGGYMELQAIRYAAMVSSMTLEQAIGSHAKMLGGPEADTIARDRILDFLDLDSVDEAELTGEVRIILVAANFSTELTTSVIWLNKHDVDITCIRLKPYRVENQVFIDATQIIPLPEAADYEIRVRAQAQEAKKVRGVRQEIFNRFWSQFIDRSKSRTQLFAGRSTTVDHWLSGRIGRSGFSLNVAVAKDSTRVECYISMGAGSEERNQVAFDTLAAQKQAIEKTFGEALEWDDLPGRIGCRISKEIPGGWKMPEADWPQFQDRIVDTCARLEAALKAPIHALKI